VCQRSSNHKLKAIHNCSPACYPVPQGVSKIVKSQIESNSQQDCIVAPAFLWCVKDRQITNWKQFTTAKEPILEIYMVCQRSSNHKLKAIHNKQDRNELSKTGVSKIVKSQIESNSQLIRVISQDVYWCVKDRQITNWKQFTTWYGKSCYRPLVCQRSSNHKLKAIHNTLNKVDEHA